MTKNKHLGRWTDLRIGFNLGMETYRQHLPPSSLENVSSPPFLGGGSQASEETGFRSKALFQDAVCWG